MSHPTLDRQLRRLRLDAGEAPTAAEWAELLERVAATYATADTERYLLERSFTISSDEMQELYRTLRRREAEQAALTRVAIAVASDEDPAQVFDLVAEEAARLFGADGGRVVRFAGDEGVVVGAWGGDPVLAERSRAARIPLDGDSASAQVHRTGGPVRIDECPLPASADPTAPAGFRAGVAAPIHLKGGLWGAVASMSAKPGGLPPMAEDTLAQFARMVALAIANSEARSQLQLRAASDPLTGLANHREFHERLAGEVARAERDGAPALAGADGPRPLQAGQRHPRPPGGRPRAARAAERLRVGERARARSSARVGRRGVRLDPARSRPRPTPTPPPSACARRSPTRPSPRLGRLTTSCGVCDLAAPAAPRALPAGRQRPLRGQEPRARPHRRASRLRPSYDLTANERGRAPRAAERPQRAAGPRAGHRREGRLHPAALRAGRRPRRAPRDGPRLVGPRAPRRLREAGLVHDVGKIGVSDAILLKPGRLTPSEYATGQGARGARRQDRAGGADRRPGVVGARTTTSAGTAAATPTASSGEEIPEGARLLALADTWDAITVARNYGSPMTVPEALDECRRNAGTQFWPDAVRGTGDPDRRRRGARRPRRRAPLAHEREGGGRHGSGQPVTPRA